MAEIKNEKVYQHIAIRFHLLAANVSFIVFQIIRQGQKIIPLLDKTAHPQNWFSRFQPQQLSLNNCYVCQSAELQSIAQLNAHQEFQLYKHKPSQQLYKRFVIIKQFSKSCLNKLDIICKTQLMYMPLGNR